MNKWGKVGLILITIVLVFQSVLLLNLNKKVNLIDDNTQSQYSDLIHNVLNIQSNVQGTIDDELGKSHLTKEVSFKFDTVIEGGYTLDVRAELSRVDENSKVMFLYKANTSKEWAEVEMDKINALSYSCKINVLSEDEYSYKVVTIGTLSESGDIEPIYKSDYIPESPYVSGYGNDNNNLNIILTRELGIVNDDDFKIKKLEAIIGSNDKEKSYDFKESSSLTDIENEEDTLTNNVYYEVNVPSKDYKNNLKYIKVKVTYENGLVDIKDITEEIDSYYLQ